MDQKLVSSIAYHDIFDYPLTTEDFVRWIAGWKGQKKVKVEKTKIADVTYFFLNGRKKLVAQRKIGEKISQKKMTIAKSAAKILAYISTIKMVGITGWLAMMNAKVDSDIDFIVLTQKGTLWTSRLISLVCLADRVRRFGVKRQKDKLCLNMWLDESDLVWPKNDRNSYTAHEIAQVVPLVNKDKTYEKFIWENRWILDWWPKAVKTRNYESGIVNGEKKETPLSPMIQYSQFTIRLFEKLAFWLQHRYMKSKITREIVTPTRAIFHPNDFGKKVLEKLRLTSNT